MNECVGVELLDDQGKVVGFECLDTDDPCGPDNPVVAIDDPDEADALYSEFVDHWYTLQGGEA